MSVVHANIAGTDLHEDKRIKEAVRAASAGANVTLATPGTTLDGVTLAAFDRVLLKDQTTASENGIYTWSAGASALVRTSDANVPVLFCYGFKVFVREGTTNAATYWTFTQTAQTATVVLGTTALTFAKDVGSAQSTTAAAVATSGTINTAGVTVARVSPAAAVTGVILQSGTYASQKVAVINEAVAANSVTFAASATSKVADGTSDVIAGLTAREFVWDTGTSLWYPCK